jgi:hypothetical protein
MAALIAGERDPKTLAQLARSRMRTKITALGPLTDAFWPDIRSVQVRASTCACAGG